MVEEGSGDPGGSEEPEEPATPTATVAIATIEQRETFDGTLGYGERQELGLRLEGTLTALGEESAVLDRGALVGRVDDVPVHLLLGGIPQWRAFSTAMTDGADVRQFDTQATSFVVDDEGVQLPVQAQSGGEVNGVEAAKLRRRPHPGAVEHGGPTRTRSSRRSSPVTCWTISSACSPVTSARTRNARSSDRRTPGATRTGWVVRTSVFRSRQKVTDLVSVSVLLVHGADIAAAYGAAAETLDTGGDPPLVGAAMVSGLGVAGALVEVSATAAVLRPAR